MFAEALRYSNANKQSRRAIITKKLTLVDKTNVDTLRRLITCRDLTSPNVDSKL